MSAEVISFERFKEQKESLPKFTLEYQKTQLLNFLQGRKKVDYTNVGFVLLELSKKDFRFSPKTYFINEMIDSLLFELAIDKKIELRDDDGISQIRLYVEQPLQPCVIHDMILDARTKAKVLWNM
jgi:hypothetical protein